MMNSTNNVCQRQQISEISRSIAETIATEMEFWQRKNNREIKEIRLDVSPAPMKDPIIRMEQASSTGKTEYEIRYVLCAQGRMVIHLYEPKMAKENGRNQLTSSMNGAVDYTEVIKGFLNGSIVY